jgi:hypothetical protein
MDNKTTGKSPSHVARQPVKATVLNVLIASPSDVSAERDAVESVIHEWNANHRAQTGITLHPVRWETHWYPAARDRTQGIINRQIVDSGHPLIGIFGNRLGTPTGEAQSGTIEEIERFGRPADTLRCISRMHPYQGMLIAIRLRRSKSINMSGNRILCACRATNTVTSCSRYGIFKAKEWWRRGELSFSTRSSTNL